MSNFSFVQYSSKVWLSHSSKCLFCSCPFRHISFSFLENLPKGSRFSLKPKADVTFYLWVYPTSEVFSMAEESLVLPVKLKAGLLTSSWDLFLTPAVVENRLVDNTSVVRAVFSTDLSTLPSSQNVNPKSSTEFWHFLWLLLCWFFFDVCRLRYDLTLWFSTSNLCAN